MSTKLTTSSAPLTVLLSSWSGAILAELRSRLVSQGYAGLTETHLVLYGHLDCGATHAARIAQRMAVSRQAISRTLRELEALGFLRLDPHPGLRNQKLVVMTESGQRLALDARAALNDLELALADHVGQREWKIVRAALESCCAQPSDALPKKEARSPSLVKHRSNTGR
jgi:DNA-binding MarR family transcriptional regulator